VFFGLKDGWRNTMLHQILSVCHLGTFSKLKKKGCCTHGERCAACARARETL